MKKSVRKERQLPFEDLMSVKLKPGSVNTTLRKAGFSFNEEQDWDTVALLVARKIAGWLEDGAEEVDMLEVLADWSDSALEVEASERALRATIVGCAFSILYMHGYVLKKSPANATVETWEPMAISRRKSA